MKAQWNKTNKQIQGEEGHSGKGVARQIPGGDGDVDKVRERRMI